MAEANQEAFQYKTLHLKVSIHCEGCKKKVKRVLEKIPGVEKVEIDSYQHKVSVTCRVDHDTLIKKLQRSNKQASVWPEAIKKPAGNPAPSTSSESKNPKKESDDKPKEKEPKKESPEKAKEKQPEVAKEKSSEKGDEHEKAAKEKPKPKAEDEAKPKDVVKEKPKEDKKEKEKEKEKEKDVVKEKPKEEKKEEKKEKEKEKAKEHSEKEAKQSTNGENKKEKKIDGGGNEGAQHMERGLGFGQGHPSQEYNNNNYPYPYPYQPYQPQPIMSYNMAQPSSSQAYYQEPPMAGMQNFMHPYQSNPYQNNPYPYPYQYGGAATQSDNNYQYYGSSNESRTGHHEGFDSYFNEENANSCSVM